MTPVKLPVPGSPAPAFACRSTANSRYQFDTVAGRYVVLCFFGSAADATGRQTLDLITQHRRIFDDEHASFFGVSIDPEDETTGRVRQSLPGIRHFWDFDQAVSRLFGRLDPQGNYSRISFVLDERLRTYATVPFTSDPTAHVQALLRILADAPPITANREAPAPVLEIPRVFSGDLCTRLIAYYEAGGAEDSGFMRDIDGQTTGVYDYAHKRRSDKYIDDTSLREECIDRLRLCVIPEIHKAFQFRATRVERHIVACYDSASGGHFRAHRDNTTRATAHRRFAVSLVLNTGEFDGGRLRFPEFGRQTYSPPRGGAIVFSCSLLHEATPVTSGRRFVYLPFLYDETDVQIRTKGAAFLKKSAASAEREE